MDPVNYSFLILFLCNIDQLDTCTCDPNSTTVNGDLSTSSLLYLAFLSFSHLSLPHLLRL